jgi:predicted glycosyltransferase
MDLLYSSDVVISGGGTMNREAVVLGRRVYSIFGGKPGSIDLELERMGKLKMIRNIDELKSIEFKKMEEKEPKISDKTFKFIIKHIMWLYNKP